MKYLYVANWKMNLSFDESINFCTNNNNVLQQPSNSAAKIIICPSFIALAPLATLLKNSPIAIGAQNCSEYASGAYTGEVSALSLAEIGVTHCIVGHSERRMYYDETTEKIINKIKLLYANNIIPIICIGETHKDFLSNQTFTTLTQQLDPILKTLPKDRQKHIIIAYEPVWSIGTGLIPTQEQLTKVFTWIYYIYNCLIIQLNFFMAVALIKIILQSSKKYRQSMVF